MLKTDFTEMDQHSLERVLELVHKHTGIYMGANKRTLIQCRLRPRIRTLGLASYEEYFGYLDAHKSEIQEFVNLITTNETSFFRTQRVWDFFSKEFLPRWTRENPQKKLKIWSGASSSGEEAYSIGICCEEHLLKNPDFDYCINGSDISTDVLMSAEKGCYAGRSIEAFKASNRLLFDKYLEAVEGGFKVKEILKEKIRFNSHNLLFVPAHRNYYDVVFLRNVLIYFEAADQEKIIKNVGTSLVNEGLLIIGESESLGSLNTPFQYKQPLVYSKRGDRYDG